MDRVLSGTELLVAAVALNHPRFVRSCRGVFAPLLFVQLFYGEKRNIYKHVLRNHKHVKATEAMVRTLTGELRF